MACRRVFPFFFYIFPDAQMSVLRNFITLAAYKTFAHAELEMMMLS